MGWTGVDISTIFFPEFDFLISRNPSKKLGGGASGMIFIHSEHSFPHSFTQNVFKITTSNIYLCSSDDLDVDILISSISMCNRNRYINSEKHILVNDSAKALISNDSQTHMYISLSKLQNYKNTNWD